MKNQSCCFTGHRSIPVNEYFRIKRSLEDEIEKLINQGIESFYAGGALGFDTLAAQAVLRLKTQFPHISLFLILPCREQAGSWGYADKKTYNHILKNADRVLYTSENYYRGCMHTRNW